MAYEKNSDGQYIDLPLTTMPVEPDQWRDRMDITLDLLDEANRYRACMQVGDYAGAQAVLAADKTGTLSRMIIDATTITRLQHAVMALERVFVEDIDAYIRDGVFESKFLSTTATAANSAKLGGVAAASYVTESELTNTLNSKLSTYAKTADVNAKDTALQTELDALEKLVATIKATADSAVQPGDVVSNATNAANSTKWGGYSISVVSALPSSPNSKTIYLVKE